MKALAWLIVLPPVLAHADEELIGVWEYLVPAVHMDATIRFTFKTDHQFELYQNIVSRDRPLQDLDLPVDGTTEAQADGNLIVDSGFRCPGFGNLVDRGRQPVFRPGRSGPNPDPRVSGGPSYARRQNGMPVFTPR